MAVREAQPVERPDDPRLAEMGREDVAGADQILAKLAATPDERLDSLEAIVEFILAGREAMAAARR